MFSIDDRRMPYAARAARAFKYILERVIALMEQDVRSKHLVIARYAAHRWCDSTERARNDDLWAGAAGSINNRFEAATIEDATKHDSDDWANQRKQFAYSGQQPKATACYEEHARLLRSKAIGEFILKSVRFLFRGGSSNNQVATSKQYRQPQLLEVCDLDDQSLRDIGLLRIRAEQKIRKSRGT